MRFPIQESQLSIAAAGRTDLLQYVPDFNRQVQRALDFTMLDICHHHVAMTVYENWKNSLTGGLSLYVPVGNSTLAETFAHGHQGFDLIGFEQWVVASLADGDVRAEILMRQLYRWILQLKFVGAGPKDIYNMRIAFERNDSQDYWVTHFWKTLQITLVELFILEGLQG